MATKSNIPKPTYFFKKISDQSTCQAVNTRPNSVMDNLIKELEIPDNNIANTSTWNTFAVVVHSSWLKNLQSEGKCCFNHVPVSKADKITGSVTDPYVKIFIQVLNKSSGYVLPLLHSKDMSGRTDNAYTYAQLLQNVAQCNHKKLWKNAYKTLSHWEVSKEQNVVNLCEYNVMLSELLFRHYGCPIIKLKYHNASNDHGSKNNHSFKVFDCHSTLFPAVCVIEAENSFFVVFNNYLECTLIDCLTFSPALLYNSNTSCLFIIYQLLQLAKYLEDHGLTLGNLRMQDIYVTEKMWLQIIPKINDNIKKIEDNKNSDTLNNGHQAMQMCNQREKNVKIEKLCHLWLSCRMSNLDYIMELNDLAGRKVGDPQAHVVVPWVTDFSFRCGQNWRDLKKSKYRLAKGDRQLDLTYNIIEKDCENVAMNSEGQIPHHVSDVLSDITYFVYMARRTPKEVLCKYVRNNWVPAEYPVSIQRMYEWTPDECIPNFYTDPSVFKSIHEDLPDLELPSWATCAEDFVLKHREALESSYVSQNLHHWIDLTFGYKLSGSASVRAKNVCLTLVDGHKTAKRGGAVQLLITPHPPRQRASNLPPPRPLKFQRNSDSKEGIMSSNEASEDEELAYPQHISRLSREFKQRSRSRHRSSQGTNNTHSPCLTRVPFETNKIVLPKEFDPVKTLSILENIDDFNKKTFYSKIPYCAQQTKTIEKLSYINKQYDKSPKRNLSSENNYERKHVVDANFYKSHVLESRRKNAAVLCCLIVEIFLHSKMKPLMKTRDCDIKVRFETCKKVYQNNKHQLPHCVRYMSDLMFNSDVHSIDALLTNHRINVITDNGMPPPNASLLLQPLLSSLLIPFPKYFSIIFHFLQTIHEYEMASKELNMTLMYECDGKSCNDFQKVDKCKYQLDQKISEAKIWTCVAHLELCVKKVTPFTQSEIIHLILPHYVDLLKKKETAILTVWYLFDPIATLLGPDDTKKHLLKLIIPLYDDEETSVGEAKATVSITAASNRRKSIKLYHNIFLLQLIVRLGLFQFLENFTQHLVEAVGGYKDLSALDITTSGHSCVHSKTYTCKKLRYSDELVKSALSAPSNIASPDTSVSSENTTCASYRCGNEADKKTESFAEMDLFFYEPDITSDAKLKVDTNTISNSIAEKADLDICNKRTSQADSIGCNEILENEINIDTTPTTACIENKPSKGNSDESPSAESTDMKDFFGDEIKDSPIRSCLISDVSFESLIWLSHRLGPVLTCRYITRNLLKMLTLCYVGGENLAKSNQTAKTDTFSSISIAQSSLVGDKNAQKVINCLTSIVDLYGEQLIVMQYLPHMSELIASSRRRMTSPLEGGAVACMQLMKYLLPFMSDAKLIEQLQDVILKNVIYGCTRLVTWRRGNFPNGATGREALARKVLDASYALALRLGSEMTRLYLLVPAIQRFFMGFDKSGSPHQVVPSQEMDNDPDSAKKYEESQESVGGTEYVEICRDGSTTLWRMRDGQLTRKSDPRFSPPDPHCTLGAVLEELELVFTPELAEQAYRPFVNHVGKESMEQSLANWITIQQLLSDEVKLQGDRKSATQTDALRIPTSSPVLLRSEHLSNSFGSNVSLVGNRIDIIEDVETSQPEQSALDLVACKIDCDTKKNRHLRGDWLIYWEHEIGRADKDDQFNLKQIKLQTFVGHTQAVRAIHCMDNENSFITASKDKTVRLWCLRNQGDGNTIVHPAWSYNGHKKSVLALTFVEALRLTVSTDSVVHFWDPFMEAAVSQVESSYGPITTVRALGNGSKLVLCTTDLNLRLADANNAIFTATLKVAHGSSAFTIRSASSGNNWLAAGLTGGWVSVLDSRTGGILAAWRAHDADITHVQAINNSTLLTTAADNTLALWNPNDGKHIHNLRGGVESISCLTLFKNEVVSASTACRIGVHSSSSYSGVKLRSELTRGSVTALAALPLNRCLLVGSDTGVVTLLC